MKFWLDEIQIAKVYFVLNRTKNLHHGNFTNFKYFNILCVITCEEDKNWVLRFMVKKDPWLA